jgi:D-inositol-3-phosphate glycosyltransferase
VTDGRPNVAVLTANLGGGGGTGSMTAFLRTALQQHGCQVDAYSLATSASDTASVSIVRTAGLRSPRVERREWQGVPYQHVGCRARELEPARYVLSRGLRSRLATYDSVIVAVGTGQWYWRVHGLTNALLWVATTVAADRATRNEGRDGLRRIGQGAIDYAVRIIERRALRSAPALLALSSYAASAAQRITGRADIAVAPCGVDTDFFRPGGAVGNYILAVARFTDPRKAFSNLIEAYGRLRGLAGADAPRLVVAGSPPAGRDAERLDDLHLRQHVDLTGPVSLERLRSLYAGARAFVVSSDEEGLCVAAIEAMACGVPVVSTRCGGPESFVVPGQTGYLVERRDPAALANALFEVTRITDLARRMRRDCRELAEKRFSYVVAVQPFIAHVARSTQLSREAAVSTI